MQHALGIDYQQTLTIAALREQDGRGHHVRLLSDGARHVIPNAMGGAQQWGSAAVQELGADGVAVLRRETPGPWREAAASALFGALFGRTEAFLGVAPRIMNGYRVTLAIHARGHQHEAAAVRSLARHAGFDAIDVVPAAEALIARWIAADGDEVPRAGGHATVGVVAVGDTSTVAGVATVEVIGGGPPPLARLHFAAFVPIDVGCGRWITATIDAVQTRIHGSFPEGSALVLRDASIEMGGRLSLARGSESVSWSGPWRARMGADLPLSRAACGGSAWPGVADLVRMLPEALRRAGDGAAGRNALDVVLVGGIGAVWPFARDAAQQSLPQASPVWGSHDATHDVAVGAAWWPAIFPQETAWDERRIDTPEEPRRQATPRAISRPWQTER